jgi:hypothetical protein
LTDNKVRKEEDKDIIDKKKEEREEQKLDGCCLSISLSRTIL